MFESATLYITLCTRVLTLRQLSLLSRFNLTWQVLVWPIAFTAAVVDFDYRALIRNAASGSTISAAPCVWLPHCSCAPLLNWLAQ